MEIKISFIVLVCICLSSFIDGHLAACDCEEALSATNTHVQQLTKKVSEQKQAISWIKQTIKSCRRTVFARLDKHEAMIKQLKQNADFDRLTNSNINQLHLHVTAKDVKLEGQASTSCNRQTVKEENLGEESSVVELPVNNTDALAKTMTVYTPAGSNYGPLVALPGGEVLVTDRRSGTADNVVKLDQHGQVVPPIFTSENSSTVIKGMVLDGDNLYILQNHGVLIRTKLSSINIIEQQWQIPDVGSVYPGSLIGQELYLVDFDHDHAFAFNLQSNQKTVKTTRLDRPGSLTATQHRNERIYIISEYTGHRVSVFDVEWNRTAIIGGQHGSGNQQLYHPWQVTVTPWSTILVADTYNNRLSEFNLSGGFIKHRLGDELYQPLYISCSSPHLWVVQRTRGGGPRTVKRYQIVP